MKKYLTLCLCFIVIIGFVPVIAHLYSKENKLTNQNDASTSDEVQSFSDAQKCEISEDELEYVLCEAMQYTDTDSNEETKIAVLSLCLNNLLYYKESSQKLPALAVSNYSDDFLQELKGLCIDKALCITINNKRVYIPIVKHSGEHSANSEDYPYLSEIATPWERLRPDYDPDYEYPCGVSAYGIDYLCENGSSAESALGWYLQDFDIKR